MNLTSGNEMVDAMAEINFSGNIVPEAWFKNVLRPNGKPHLLAITILSDIVYWYRPTEERDENTGHIIGWKKKFKGDLLQKSYKAYSNMYGESKDSVKAAFDILENNGLVKRYLRDVELADGSIRPNVMYIELFTDAVKRITFDIPQEKKDDISEKIASYPQKFSGRVAKENGDICENIATCSADETDTLHGNFSPYPEMNPGTITENPVPSLHWKDLLVGIVFGVGIRLAVYLKGKNAKKYRKGKEYGSAELGGEKDIEPYIDKENPFNNLIFTATERMRMEGRMPSPLYNRNKNVLVIGGSGSGKTRFYAKPNLMQMNCSYVFTDPKGTVLEECGRMLEQNGYKIKVLNTIDFSKSMKYNPFSYIKKETDIMKVSDALIEGTTTGKQQGEQFWLDAERLLYNALIGYIWKYGTDEERNFGTLLDMVNAMEIREDDDKFKNTVDFMFEELQEEDPENFAVLQYLKFKQAAGKTARSIMITVGARLSRFDIKAVREVMSADELELTELGKEKSALFIITSDTTKTFNFMATILYTQLFNLLCEQADNQFKGSLPIPVHCMLDEFANLGRIPDFEILISTIRSRNISASIILQSLAQLKSIYDKQADIISDNCDTLLFLGGKGRETLKEISEAF